MDTVIKGTGTMILDMERGIVYMKMVVLLTESFVWEKVDIKRK